MHGKVLIIEDQEKIRRIIHDYFKMEGFEILEAANGKEGLETFQTEDVSLIILDIMLPELDGWSVCRRIRKNSDVPIIILTARSDDDDILLGFDLKADEYVTKPFNPQVLVARAKMLLKRANGTIIEDNNIILKDGISVNKLSREVRIGDESLKTTPKEFDILVYFMENEAKVLSRETILRAIWGYDYFGDVRVVDNHIKKLRKHLKDKAYVISTVFGVGYKFEVNE
ncbi:response regulator transcription factor [Wukongibacter baidiensis]|uniref:response regulator transcription factor n=1 Tax=Wukongibacter baidiensis TaxID=1723361 RepID=UPI003D7FEB01